MTAFSKSSASQQAKSRAGGAPGQRKSNSGEPVAANTQSESYFAARLADQARATRLAGVLRAAGALVYRELAQMLLTSASPT